MRKGAILAYPTEAVYGLGCAPLNEGAVLQLLRLKQRPVSKGLILVTANLKQLESTSANSGGKPPALNVLQVRNYFPHEVSIFNGNTDGLKTVTPIFDAATGQSLR